jgi:hypothetical protein
MHTCIALPTSLGGFRWLKVKVMYVIQGLLTNWDGENHNDLQDGRASIIPGSSFLFIYLFCSIGVWTQGPAPARHFTTRATSRCPSPFFCRYFFLNKILQFSLSGPWSSYLCFPSSWEDRHAMPSFYWLRWSLTKCILWSPISASWIASIYSYESPYLTPRFWNYCEIILVLTWINNQQ